LKKGRHAYGAKVKRRSRRGGGGSTPGSRRVLNVMNSKKIKEGGKRVKRRISGERKKDGRVSLLRKKEIVPGALSLFWKKVFVFNMTAGTEESEKSQMMSLMELFNGGGVIQYREEGLEIIPWRGEMLHRGEGARRRERIFEVEDS